MGMRVQTSGEHYTITERHFDEQQHNDNGGWAVQWAGKRNVRGVDAQMRARVRATGAWQRGEGDSLLDVGAKRANQEYTVNGRGLCIAHLVLALLSPEAGQFAQAWERGLLARGDGCGGRGIWGQRRSGG